MNRQVPPYRPGSKPSEARVEFLTGLLIDKVKERKNNIKMGIKELFRRHDLDNSGFLEIRESIRALNDFLPGYDQMEYQGIVKMFDPNDDGRLDINEVSQAMNDFHYGDTVAAPPPPPKDWGTQRFEDPPPPPKYQDHVTRSMKASMNPLMKKQHGNGASAAALHATDDDDDETASDAGSNFSFPEEVRERFWPGISAERHYRFLKKLRDTLYEKYKGKYAKTSGTTRLFVPKDDLIERFARQEVRKMFESNNSKDVAVDDDGNRRVSFEKFRAVLKVFRTPGQPFATWPDMQDLHGLCDNGNISTFFKVLYADPKEETPEGEVADAREKATRELPVMEYPQTNTCVFPPLGWQEDREKLLKRSGTVPSQGLALEYVHGFNGDANGRNLFEVKDPSSGVLLLVWFVAAIVVIHDPSAKTQRYFTGHSEGIVSLAVDSSGTLAASAQCATVIKGHSQPPIIHVWDIETLEILRTIDGGNTSANIQRSVSGLSFSSDSSMLLLVGADDKHVVSIFNLTDGKPPSLITDAPGQVGLPLQIHSTCCAPPLVCKAYCAEMVWVTTGEASHVKFWCWKPNQQDPLVLVKGTFNRIPTPRVLWAIAHVPNDNVTFTGTSDGRVLMWRAPGDCFAAQLLHKPDAMVYALAFTGDGKMMWSGAGDQTVCMWSMKDYKFTKLRSYDFSFEGAGMLTSSLSSKEAAAEMNDQPTNWMSSTRSGKSGGVALTKTASKKSGSKAKPGAQAELIRKRPGTDAKPVYVKELVVVSQDMHGEGGGGLIVATDGGAMWYLDWGLQTVEEIYSYHGGSPSKSNPMLGGVHGLCPHPTRNAVFATCGEDKQLAIWDAAARQRRAVRKVQEMAKTLSWSPDAEHIAVGFAGGYFGVYGAASLQRVAWHRRTTGGIEVVKYSPNGRQVATGSHENVIDLYDVKNKASPYHHRKRLLGHSSTVVHLDWSCDSRVIQSNCQAFEILYWDAIKGTNLRNTKDSTESDTVWSTWSCRLGFPVMGIWGQRMGRTDIDCVSRSPNGNLLVFGDDSGNVNLVNAPCIVRHAPRRIYAGHSAHVVDLAFLGDHRVVSCGGCDKAVFQFRVVAAPSTETENLLMHEGTRGRLATTQAFNGGYSGTVEESGGVEYDDRQHGGAPLRRWGESIALPMKGIARPAWIKERYSHGNTLGSAFQQTSSGAKLVV